MISFLDPEEILDKLDLEPGLAAAEFGCGSGSFTIPLAKRLKDGLVYAVDIQREPLSALKGRVQAENVNNVRIIRGNLEKTEGSTLGPGSVDLVLIVNVFFQSEEKEKIITEAGRVLKQGGKMVVIDWKPKAPKGPEKGVAADKIKKMAEKEGFSLEEQFDIEKYHYGLVFNK